MTANPYVQAAEGPSWHSGTFLIDDIASLSEDISSGDWLAAGMDAVSTVMDTVATVSDPLGSAIAAGIGFILDHLEPLKGWLDDLTGDAGQVTANAGTYKNVAKGLAGEATTLTSSVERDLADQTAQILDAYRKQMGHISDALNVLAKSADATGGALEIAAMIVQVVHDTVRDAISEIVGSAISYAAELVFTLGTATPLVIEQVTTRVSEIAERIGKDVTNVVKSTSSLKDLIKKLDGLVQDLGPELKKLLKDAGHGETPHSTPDTPKGHTPDEPGAPHEPDANTPTTDHGHEPDKAAEDGRPDDTRNGCGDPVDVATGAVYLAQTDLTLPGDLPLVITRKHSSHWTYGQWFGTSWSSTFDERVEISGSAAGEQSVVVVRDDAAAQVFPMPAEGAPTKPVAGGTTTLHRTPTGGFVLLDAATGFSRHYPMSQSGRAWLGSLTDASGHRVTILRDQKGAPVEVSHSGGYRVLVGTEGRRVTRLTVVDADGQQPVEVARYDYDALGDLVGVVNDSGVPLVFAYTDHRLTQWTDRNGTLYRYLYDTQGRCVAQGGSDGVMRNDFSYSAPDAEGLRTTVVTDSRGATTTFLVNALFQIVAQTDPLGHVTRSEWDAENRLLARTDPLGRTTRFAYDGDGNLTVLTRPDGTHQRVDWVATPAGARPAVVTLADGIVWTYTYDEAGRQVSVTDPLGATTAYGYDESGHLSSVVDALSRVRQIENDACGLPLRVVDADGRLTEFTRDHLGRVVVTTDAVGARTAYEWTPSGQLAARHLPDGSTESWTYDGEGNPVSYTDAAGRRTQTRFTHFDMPAEVTAPDGTVSRYAYDPELRLTSVTGPQGAVWSYTYDAAGRMVAETDYNGRVLTYVYDAAGQLVEQINGAGQRIAYRYDVAGRTVSQQTDEQITTLAYDPLGRLLRATSPGVDLVIERDPLGRVLSESVNGRTVATTYDRLGRPTHRTTPAGVETAWTYGAGIAPERITLADQEIAFERDLTGRETRRTTGDVVLEQTWDLLGQPLTQRLQRAGQGPGVSIGDRLSGAGPVAAVPDVLQERTYTYESAGRLIGVQDRLTGARRFELDLADRITSVAVDGSVAEAYTYDPLGNITRSAASGDDGEHRAYEGTLLTRAGRSRYAYDAQGRLVRHTRTRLSEKPDTWLYEWDADDRLTAVRTPDGIRWTYLYDALGRRVAKRRLGATGEVVEETLFAWDGAVLVEQTAGTDTMSWAYQGYQPLAQVTLTRAEVDARFYAIVTDLAGAPSELVSPDGTVVWHARRTIWGSSANGDQDLTPLRFAGQYADLETGLWYNNQRYYDPRSGRYLSQDPMGLEAAPNSNAYVTNPTIYIDPTGFVSEAGCADKLRNALNNAGQTEPSTPHSPHHIIAGNSPKAAQARKVLENFGIGVNSAENGVWLPRSSSSPNPGGLSVHSRVHTNEYYNYVNDLMSGARTKQEALDVIGHVRRQLLGGYWP